MSVQLSELPYALNALEPYISEQTLSYHYGKHHAGYVETVNKLIVGTAMADKSLKEIILMAASDSSLTPIFNSAAQSYNHEFYWQSLSPAQTQPSPALAEAINRDFGSMEALQQQLKTVALNRFGSGWAWLVCDRNKQLQIIATANAETPLTRSDVKALLCLDVWEHAYYLDYQNRRGDYLQAVIEHCLNWTFASQRFEKP